MDTVALFNDICKTFCFIMRSQKGKNRLFSMWSPKLNLEACDIKGFELDRKEEALVLEKREQVFKLVTEALRAGTLPPGHLGHTMHGELVHWNRLTTACKSHGAAAGDLLWYVMCAPCKRVLQDDVAQQLLEKVELLSPNTKSARMLRIKQVMLQVFCYEPDSKSRGGCAYDAAKCFECQRVSGVVPFYNTIPRAGRKARGVAATMHEARAPGEAMHSFEHTFQQQCLETFDIDTAGDTAGDEDAPYEQEDLPTSDEEERGGLEQGPVLMMENSGSEGQLDVSEFFAGEDLLDGDFLGLFDNERDTFVFSESAEQDPGGDSMHISTRVAPCLHSA